MNTKIKVLSIFGTRPEAIKMAPVIMALQSEKQIHSIVCVTAQHREMLDQVLDSFKINVDYDLNLMKENQSLSGLSSSILVSLNSIIAKEELDLVLVHGDTTTTFMSALVSFYNKVAVGHVEAGLRSNNIYSPYPEEMNRKLTGQLATLHFAPTIGNKQNLIAEGIKSGIYITGNTVIDAVKTLVRGEYKFRNQALSGLNLHEGKTIVVTAHRRENSGQPLINICEAIKEIVQTHIDVRVLLPMHLNPTVRNCLQTMLGNLDRVFLLDPLDVRDMHNLIARCHFVLTDSGGLQEEAPSLGKPVLVMRTETERPEAVEAGTVAVIGVEKNNIVKRVNELLDDPQVYNRMATAVNPYGDGHAAERIVKAIMHWAGLCTNPDEFLS